MRRFIPTFDEDLPTLFLLALMLLIPAAAMSTAGWADGLTMLYLLVIASLVLGYLLAVSRFPDLVVIAFAAVYGVFATWLVGGQMVKGVTGWYDVQMEVIFRVTRWAQQAVGGGFSRDNLIFLVTLAVVFWFLGINAALNTFRSRQLWIASIPPGLVLLINTYYYYGSARMDLFLVSYLFVVFILAVRTNTLLRERLWRRARVGYSAGVRGDLLRGGAIGAVLLVIVAFSAPTAQASDQLASAWDRSINPWNRVQDTFNRLFSGLQGGSGSTADYYGGATLTLGGPVSLTDATVMYVFAPPGYHYYWRSKLFDYYDGRRWLTLADERKDTDYGVLPAEEQETYLLRANIQQQFQMVVPSTRLIYAAPQAVSYSSLPVTYDEIYTLPPSKNFGTVVEVRGVNTLTAGRTYSVTSSLSVADETSLRGAGTAYPDWVTKRYLQLPQDITQRTRDLAASLTAGKANPYDKARAIETYLRDNIKYDVSIDPPPANVEPVDYFLFTSKRGYCNYYASAMVVMLRSQGIPARIAAGFAQGDLDPNIKGYRVRELNAHTWVEAYFPSYGWIEFEPTTIIAPIIRPLTTAPGDTADVVGRERGPAATPTVDVLRGGLNNANTHNTGQYTPDTTFTLPAWLGWVIGLLVAAALAAGGLWFWLELRGMRGLSEVSRSYARMNLFATLGGLPMKNGTTPAERGEQIAALVPKREEVVRRIAAQYAREQYAQPAPAIGPDARRAELAASDWQMLRPELLRRMAAVLLSRLRPGKK